MATDHWVSSIAMKTFTPRCMVSDITVWIETASSRTWVYTFIVQTCFVSGTVSIGYAFRFTTKIWVAEIIRQASTWTGTAFFFTYSVGATRGWITRGSFNFNWLDYYFTNLLWLSLYCFDTMYFLTWSKVTTDEWVSAVIGLTTTSRWMSYYCTYCWSTTRSRARICTFLI